MGLVAEKRADSCDSKGVARRSYPDQRPVAAPGPELGTRAEARSHRVERDVADRLQEVPFVLDRLALVAALERVPTHLVAPVEPLRKAGAHELHSLRELRHPRIDHQMQ